MKRLLSFLLVIALLIPAAAFADSPADYTPKAEGMLVMGPGSSAVPESTPATGSGSSESTTPSTGSGESTTPSTGSGESTTPSTGSGESTAPSTGSGESTTPSTGSGESTAPSTGSGESTAPSTGSGESTAPSTGSGESTTPSTGSGESTTPSTGSGETTTPATGSGDTASETVTRTLRYGMEGKDVLTVASRLKSLGYYGGEVNEFFGTSLTTAVRNYQMDWNKNHPSEKQLTVDGVVGPATRAAIFGSQEPAIQPSDKELNINLRLGMKGEEVLTAQKRLSQLGFYLGELNGEFTSSMEYAVRLFQAKNELTVTGEINQITRNMLYNNASVRSADDPDYTEGTLRLKSSGEAVKELQRHLRQTYYYSGTIDGVFGTAVQNAVKAFQASAGLNPDGVVGPRTKEALYNRSASIFKGGIPSRTLSQGSRGYDVYVLQNKLINLNYKFVSWYEPGVFDESTVSVVKKFQQNNGLKVTGTYDSTMRRYLWPTTVEAEEKDNQQYEGTPDDPYVGRTLKLHAYGEDVKAIQMKLLATGYMTGNADGIYGPLTKAAVLRFQKAYNLKPDGVVGPKTWSMINTVLNSKGAEQTKVNADYTIVGDKTYVGAYNRTLRIGSYGNDVKKLQEKLKNMGYNPGSVDGIFGVKTYAAVREFQFYNNLVADGVAGPKTFVVLHWGD